MHERYSGQTNEKALFERDEAGQAWRQAQEWRDKLVAEYGNWASVPNKMRTQLARHLRSAGMTYRPGRGWENRNSAALSSIHGK